MNILQTYLDDLEKDFYLRNTTYLMQIGDQSFREMLTGLYNSADIQMMTVATILNAIYTDGKPTFFLSMRSLSTLLSEDKNLSYKSRRGIAVSEYREAYAKALNYFREKDAFELNFEASKKTKMPMCVCLVDEMTLRSMGDQMMIKLASNWHQMVIKTRQVMESTEQSGNFIHDNINVNANVKQERQTVPALPSNEEDEEESNSNSLPEEGEFHQKPLKELVVVWKARYGTDLKCVASANKATSIPELAKILTDNFYWDVSASKVADILFGPKPKASLIEWKEEVTRALEEAIILAGKESKKEFFSNLSCF